MKPILFSTGYRDIVFRIPPFSELPPEHIDDIFSRIEIRIYSVEKDEYVFVQGDTCNRLYMLIDGRLRSESVNVYGDSLLLGHMKEPGVFALYPLFNEENMFLASFIAEEDSIIATVEKESFFDLIKSYPELLKDVICLSNRCAGCRSERLDILQRKTIRERVAAYLLKYDTSSGYAEVIHTQSQLADYLCVSRPALSTEINRMEREGLIRRASRGRVKILSDLNELL